jgi:hypothetical protein
MVVIEIFLPLRDRDGRPFPAPTYDVIKAALADRFGGVTAFVRAPAEGVWKPDAGHEVHDEIAIFEVMTETLDAGWWRDYRADLERQFEQDEILIRAYEVTRL